MNAITAPGAFAVLGVSMFLRLIRAYVDFSVLTGTKDDGAIAYAWYYQNGSDCNKGLTDSYREFWL